MDAAADTPCTVARGDVGTVAHTAAIGWCPDQVPAVDDVATGKGVTAGEVAGYVVADDVVGSGP